MVEVRENGSVTAEYSYDANGNRTSYSTPTDTITATYDSQDRMLTYGEASYSYGPRGDLQQKIVGADTTSYNYDNQGNLRSVTLPEGKHIEYIIDGQDRRVAKKVNGQITKRWLYADGLMPVAELDSTGSVEKRYGPGYIVKNDPTYRVIKDHLGSVRMIVNSQTGEVVQRINYDAWGNITQLQNEDEFIRQLADFAGGLYDSDTGLIRFGARDYNPQTGRWTSKDPILFDGGTSNLYEYALNDPVNNIDPDGLQALAIRDFAAGLSSTISLGLSELLLDQLGSYGRRDKCLTAYSAGQWAGAIADVAFGGKGLLSAFKNASKKGVTVIGHLPDYVNVAKEMGANYLKPSSDWNWRKQGRFIQEVIERGDDVFIGTKIRQGPSVLKKEIKQLIKGGYRPKEQGSKWLIKE